MHPEYEYLNILRDVLDHGERRTGRNGMIASSFGKTMTFDVNKYGFPLLTTKRMFTRGIIEELLWFLRGSTNVQELRDKKVHIWDANSSREWLDSVGLSHLPEYDIGCGYGYQWRSSGGDYPERNGIDQLRYVLNELHTNPHGRRAVLNAWNPSQLKGMALPPCHMSYQFYRNEHGLSVMMYQRSADLVAGVPFNIASTALFASILAKVLHTKVDRVIICMGDAHIYGQHMDAATEQLERTPLPFCVLDILKEAPSLDASIDEKIAWIESLQEYDFMFNNYVYHPAIKIQMVA